MFIFIPTGMNYRTERLPLVTLSLIGINTLVYVVQLICFFITQGDSDEWVYAHLWLIPAISYPWTYLTSMFVHAGFFHLFGNMIFLFLFGSCVEDMIGRFKFTIFYLIGGLVAELSYITVSSGHFSSEIPMGGASGAISTCMGMYLLLRAGADIEFKYFFWFFYIRAGEFEIPAWVAIGFWFLSDVVGMVVGIYSDHRGGGVAFGAHVGGLLAGVAMIGAQKWKERPTAEEVAEKKMIIDPAKLIARTRPQVAPAAVTSETPTIYLHDGAAQSGPFTLTHVQAMLRNGEIHREAQYWSEGMENWEGVADLSPHPVE